MGENAATDVSFVSSTQLTAKAPQSPTPNPQSLDVTVTNLDTQSGTLTDAFTYVPPPTVTGISPAYGPVSGGSDISITGTDFTYGVTVKMGEHDATQVSVHSDTLIIARTPAGNITTEQPYKVDVTVSHPISDSDTLTDAFTYIPAPSITDVSPSETLRIGGSDITITGSNIQTGASVKLDGRLARDVVVVSANQITAKIPPGSLGQAILTVTNPDGQVAEHPFRYTNAVQLDVQAGREHHISFSGVSLDIPTGAFPSDKTLTFELPTDVPSYLSGLSAMDQVVALHLPEEPDATPDQPLTLTLHYQESALPSGLTEDTLRVYSLTEGQWKFMGGALDTDANTVTLQLDTLACYALLAGYGYGDVTGNGRISAYDSGLILQKAVGLIGELPMQSYPAFTFPVADVSGNGAISAFDAGLVLRKAVGLYPHLQYPERMEFPCQVLTSPTLHPFQPLQAQLVTKQVKGGIEVSLSVEETRDAIAVDIDWSYDAKQFDVTSVGALGLSEDTHSYVNNTSGRLRIGLVSMTDIHTQMQSSSVAEWTVAEWTVAEWTVAEWTVAVYNDAHQEHLVAALQTLTLQLDEAKCVVDVMHSAATPRTTQLLPNYPNPFNPDTWVPYVLSSESSVSFHIYNALGQRVRSLELGRQPAGVYGHGEGALHWDGRTDWGEPVASGVYFCVLETKGGKTDGLTTSRKMVVRR